MTKCENCKHFFYDDSTGTSDCMMLEDGKLTSYEVEVCFCEGKGKCSKYESGFDPEEERYIEQMMQEEWS